MVPQHVTTLSREHHCCLHPTRTSTAWACIEFSASITQPSSTCYSTFHNRMTKSIVYRIYSLLLPIPQTSACGLFDFLSIVAPSATGFSPSATNSDCDCFIVSMASRSMRLMSSSLVGMSWMSPMTWPAVHTWGLSAIAWRI